VILPSSIWQVLVQIWQVVTLIQGLLNLLRHVVHLISDICLYHQYLLQLHHPSRFVLHNTAIIAKHNVSSSLFISECHDHESILITAYTESSIHWVQHTPSTEYTEYSIHRVLCTSSTTYTEYSIHRVQNRLSTAYTKYTVHRVQFAPSTAYTEYSIQRVQHTASTAYTEYSIHWVQHPWKIFWLPFIHMFSNWHLNVAPASGMPPYKIDRYQPALHDCSTSAKTKSPSLNLFSLLYPQTQKNEIEDSLKYGIALVFHSVHWVVAMLFSSLTTSVPTVANVTMSTWRTVNTAFGDVTYHFAPYSYITQFDQSSQSWK